MVSWRIQPRNWRTGQRRWVDPPQRTGGPTLRVHYAGPTSYSYSYPTWFAEGSLREPRFVRQKARRHGAARLHRQGGSALSPLGRARWRRPIPTRPRRSSSCFGRRRLTPGTSGQESQRAADRFAHLLNFTFALEGVAEHGDGASVVQVSQPPGGGRPHRRVTVAQSAQQMRQGIPVNQRLGGPELPAVAAGSRGCSTTPAYRRR